MIDIDKMFAKMAEVRLDGGRDPILGVGTFVVELEALGMHESADPAKNNAPFFKAGFKIIESDSPEHVAGSQAVQILINKSLAFGTKDILALIVAALGTDPKRAQPEDIQLATLLWRYIGGSEPAAKEIEAMNADLAPEDRFTKTFFMGRRVAVTVRVVSPTKPFKEYTWSAVPSAS